MIHLTSQTCILIAVQPADFRCGIDGFVARCQQDSRSGILFVFTNRARTMIRVLTYESGGFWLIHKRLSKGKFAQWPAHNNNPVCEVIAKQLVSFLKGNQVNFTPVNKT